MVLRLAMHQLVITVGANGNLVVLLTVGIAVQRKRNWNVAQIWILNFKWHVAMQQKRNWNIAEKRIKRQIRSSPPQSCFASSSSPRFTNFLKIPVTLHQIKYINPISQLCQFLEYLIIGPNWPFSLESDFSEIQNWGFWWAYHQTL